MVIAVIVATVVVLLGGVFVYKYYFSRGVKIVSSKIGEFDRVLFKIYSDKAYSNGKNLECLNSYDNSLNLNKDFDIFKSCPSLVEGINTKITPFSAKSAEEGLEVFIGLKEIIKNPEPVIKYLIKNRGSKSDEYSLILNKFIDSNYISQDPNNSSFSMELILGGSSDDPFPVDTLSVSDNSYLAIISDIPSSGAYNIYDYLYILNFSQNNIEIKPFNDIINTANNKVFLFSDTNPASEGLVNASFNHNDNTFHIQGFRPFGMFPCNIDNVYKFFGDRLILVSQNQAKDCSKYDIQSPTDIPDNFDSTSVEIFKASPDILEQAKEYKL